MFRKNLFQHVIRWRFAFAERIGDIAKAGPCTGAFARVVVDDGVDLKLAVGEEGGGVVTVHCEGLDGVVVFLLLS